MSSCVISYQDLQETLIEAYKSDFEKYKNLSAIIQDVMSLGNLPEESKIHAIWFYAGYINSAASSIEELQTKEWKDGKYAAIHNYLTPLLTGKAEFNYDNIIAEVEKMLKVELDTETQTTESKIREDIADLKKIPDENLLKNIDDIVNNILDNLDVLDPVMIDSNNTLALELLTNLKSALANMEKPNPYYMSRIDSVMREVKRSYEIGESYIDLSLIRGIGIYNGEPIKKIRKHEDGSYVEVVFDRSLGKFLYYNPGQANHLTPLDAVEYKDIITEILTEKNNPSDVNKKNGNLRLSLEDIASGIFLGKSYTYGTTNELLDTSIETIFSNASASGTNFIDSIDITATTKNADLLAKRKQRIDEAIPGNRISSETYEYPAARNILKKGRGPILTYSLPTSDFDIVISTKDGEISFSPIASVKNLVFLYPDNTTEKVDFKNPQHRNLLKSKLEIRNLEWDYGRMSNYHPVTDAEIDKLEKAVDIYNEFSKEVFERINQSGQKEISIKDIFNKYYNLTNNIINLEFGSGEVVKSSLQEHIDKFDGRLSVDIIDENGDKIPFEKVPVVIVRNKNGFMELVNPLKPGQKIVGENGKTYESFKVFFEENYPNIDIQAIGKKIPKRNAAFINLIPTTFGYRSTITPLNYSTSVDSDFAKMNFAATMMVSFDKAFITKGNTFMQNFNNRLWGFNLTDSNIYPEFIIKRQTEDKKIFGIGFDILNKKVESEETGVEKTLYTPEEISEFKAYAKKNLNFVIEDSVLYGPNGLFTVVQEIFKNADIQIPKDATVAEVGQLATEALSKVKDPSLIKRLNQAYIALSADIRSRFDYVMSKADHPLITEDFKKNALFTGDSRELNVKNRTKQGFDKNPISNFVVVDAENIKTQLRIYPKDYSQKISYVPPSAASVLSDTNFEVDAGVIVSANPTVVNPETEEKKDNKPDDDNPSSDDIATSDDDITFSINQSLEGVMILSEKEFAQEIAAMKDLLPSSFTFTAKDLSGLKIDGDALGYIKKLSIFLNSTFRAKGVAYHEGFHGVFRNLLTTEQQQYYLSRVAKSLGDYKEDENGKYITVNGKKVYANDFRKERRFFHLTDEQVKNLIYEEYLADSFADYMETNKAPRTWMEKLFAWLKKLINKFRKGGEIQNLFYDISAGKFKNVSIRDTISNTETAYSVYKGIPYIRLKDVTKPFDPKSNPVLKYNPVIQSSIVTELSSKVIKRMIELKNIHLGNYVEKDMSSTFPLGVSEVFSAKTKVTEEDLFDIAVQDVVKEYDINKLISQKPQLEKQIRDTFEDSWNNARWLLGQYHKGNEMFQTKNDSGVAKYDGLNLSSTDSSQLSISIANAELFKQDTLKEYKDLDVIDSENEEDDVFSYEKENYKDTQSFITSPPDEGDAAFQQLFKYISYDYTDPILGVKYKKMVDPKNIFNIIRKITSRTVDKLKIVPAIQNQISLSTDIINNFYLNIQPNLINKNVIPEDITKEIELRDSLKAVLNTLNDIVQFDENLMPMKNIHVFNQFVKVFNLVDITSSQINLETTFSRNTEKNIYEPKDQIYRMSDIVVGSDINKIRQELQERLRLLNVPEDVLSQAIQSLDSVKELSDKDVVMSKYTTNGVFNEAAMKKLVQKVYTGLSNLNLGIPYSVIELALTYEASKAYGKDKINYFPQGTNSRKLLAANKSILHLISKLDSKLLSENLPKVLRLANGAGSLTTNPELLKYSNVFLYVYSSAAGEFILNHDPTFAGSTTKNANGDMVQKFVRPVPSIIGLLKLQSKDTIEEGLDELIKEDFEGFESYFKDNPLLDLTDPKNAFFLSNMKISAFAGFQQTQLINNVEGFEKTRESTTFSDIDDKSYALSMMGLFANRESNTIEETANKNIKEKVVFFKRILSQFEGTSTSMVIDGLYKDYFNDTFEVVDGKTVKKTSKIIDSNGASTIANTLLLAAKQEYNSIRKNFTDKRLNNPVTKFEGYNIKEGDRGFKFTDCADFFALNVDPEKVEKNEDLKERVSLADSLTEAAKSDKDFDQFLKDNPELFQKLIGQLDKFADDQYKVFETLLKKLNIKDFDLPTVEQLKGTESKNTFFPERFKKEFFFNTWVNGIFINQIFEGQKSVGLKNAADYFKRQKSGAAAGSNILVATSKVKNSRVAVVQKIQYWINNKQLNNQQPLENPPLDANGKPLEGWVKVEFFDGQALNNINRIRKILDSQGKLSPDVDQILRKMRYFVGESDPNYLKALKRLQDAGIVFHSLKTVSASPMFYIKQSEHTLLRKDVSVLKPEFRSVNSMRGKDLNIRMTYEKLDELWEMADFYASMLEEGNPEKMEEYQQKYDFVIKKIHSYYQPIKGKEILHNVLNSMELHRIDQFIDANASKRATVETLKFNLNDANSKDFYFDLSKSTFKVPNIYTFIQVETGHRLDNITQGIQQKLLIMTQLDPESPEYAQIKKDIRNYSSELADVVDSQLETIKRIVNGNDGGLLAELYTNIADGLRSQGNNTDLKWFELNEDGSIIYDPNLPAVSKAIEYYLYSFFNKNLFDRKVAGEKYYHVSPWGFKIREKNGKIITQDEYVKNPELYDDATIRYPEIKEEEVEVVDQKTGKKEKIKRYVVEVIVPKQLKDIDKELLEKYMAEKWRDTFFATRIPTEGKRSMMVCKIVDYMDEAYGNSIVVPFQLHMLAGSDFDIDALYSYKYDSYKSISGKKIIYGDYSYYMKNYGMTKDEAKFIEYLTHISKDPLYKAAINNEIKRINQQSTSLVLKKRNVSSIARTKMNILQNIRSSFGKSNITNLLNNLSKDPDDYDSVIRFIATFNVLKKLEDSNLPTTVAQLKNSKVNHVPYVTFNNILESKIKILQDPAVFKKFMSDENERADAAAKPYANLVEELNLSEKEIYARQHVATPTALIEARSLNSEFKDCLGIAASLNKIISLLETINGKLSKPVVDAYIVDAKNKPKKKTIDRIGKGAVQRVGGAVGVFADAIKSPYPGPLGLNFYNTPVYLTMTALDLPLRAAIMYQSLPVIKESISEFRESSKSFYASKLRQRPISFQKFLNAKINEMSSKEGIDKSIFNSLNEIENYKLTWNDKVSPTTDEQIMSGNIPIGNFGWELTDKNGNSFNKETQDLILLNLFNKFLAISNDLSFNLNKATDLLKSLNPDQDQVDKLLNTVERLKANVNSDASLFDPQTVKDLFKNNPVLESSLKALRYVSDSSKKVLLEKTSFMKGLTSLFSSFLAYEDDFDTKSEIRKDIKAFVSLYFQRLVAESNPDSFVNSLYLDQLNPDNFLSDETVNDFRELKARFPRNQFLMNINPVIDGNPNVKIATLLETRSGVSSKTKENMENDLEFLLKHADPNVRNKAYRIVFHGIIKSGAQKVAGSYYDILPAALSKGMSDRLKAFREDLIELDSIIQKEYKVDILTGKISESAITKYKTKLKEIINKNFAGSSAEDFIKSAIVKIISSKIKSEDYVKKAVNIARLEISPLDLYNFLGKVTPSVNNIINVSKSGSSITYSKPDTVTSRLSESEYELFSPLGNTFLIDLSNINVKEDNVARSILWNQDIIPRSDGKFNFPLYKINAFDQLLVLKEIDDKSVGETFIDTLSETDLNTSDGPRSLSGSKAIYEIVAREGSNKISPLAFSHDAGVSIRNSLNPVQQMTSDVLEPLPKFFSINDTLGRMYLMTKIALPSKEYRNKSFITTNGKVVSVGNRFMKYSIKDGKLFGQVNGVSNPIEIVESRLDGFAQILKKGSWENLKTDLSFEEFLNGEKSIFVYDLVSSEIPIIKTVTPTETIEKKTPEFDKLPRKSATPTMTYAGIGSRETPQEVLDQMTKVASYLESLGYTLRSGGAKGADTAFENGAKSKKEIFKGLDPTGPREKAIAHEIHPDLTGAMNASKRKAEAAGKNGDMSAQAVENLMARNTNQVFGKNLDTPVDFVLAYDKSSWTGVGARPPKGGTLQAIDMAARKGIPVINMADSNWREQLKTVLANNKGLPSVAGNSNVKVISTDYGVVQAETNPTEEHTQEIVNLIAPQIKKQAYKENIGVNANWQFSFGKMWSRVNLKGQPLLVDSFAGVAKVKQKIEDLKQKGIFTDKNAFIYDYHAKDQNGDALAPISDLQPLISEIEKTLGISMKDYDSVLGNIYLDKQSIAPHRDTTESKSAEGYPVVVYTIGNDAGLGIWDNNAGGVTFANSYKDDRGSMPTNEIKSTNGTIYTFGMDGRGRFNLVHTTPLGDIKKKSFPPITLSDGRVITNYTITLTFRRAGDLTKGMDTKPAKLSTAQPSSQEIAPGVFLTEQQINLAKQNKIEQNFYDKKPYAKETDATGKVTKWEVYKSKNGKSSMQASLDGDRTETTRSPREIEKIQSLAKDQGIAKGITGTIVWMEGQVDNVKNSTNIKGDWFRITSEPYTPNQKDFDAYENWESNVWRDVWRDRSRNFRIGELDEWKSIRFERVSKPTTESDVSEDLKTILLKPYKGYENGLWYWFVEKAKLVDPSKVDSIKNAKDYHTAYLIGSKISNTKETDILFNKIVDEIKKSQQQGSDLIEPTRTEDTGYKYYGANYTIILENGVGVDVKNYKGKPAAKKKLLDAYNANPDVDPQSGKKFRNIKPGPKKEEQKDENKKYQLFPGVYANEGQKQAIDKIEEFLSSKDDQFLLKGRGGTGKTTIIKKAIAGIAPDRIIGATISDEARGVLQENMKGYTTMTIASLLGLVPDYNPITGLEFFRQKEEDEIKRDVFGEPIPEPIENIDYVIIDEASMIDDATYQIILSKKKPNAKIIFMGDNVQIPPINNEGKDSPVWDLIGGKNFAELSERMRQGKESPILGITDLYAENVENIQNGKPGVANPLVERVNQFENGEGVLFLNKREDLINQYIKDISNSKDSKESIIVSGTNKVADAVNDAVRQKIFNTSEPYVKDDLVRLYSPFVVKEGSKIIDVMPNGYKGRITEVEESDFISVGKESIQLYKITLEHDGIDKEGNPKKEYKKFTTVNPKDKGLVKSILNELAIEAKKYPKRSEQAKKAWIRFYNLKDRVANIGYAYAITSHKVQGSTYNSTYVMESDIMNFPGGREQTNRMMYTAVSRPRKKLVIYNPNQIISTQKTQVSDAMSNLEGQRKLDDEITNIVNEKKEDSKPCNG